MQPDIHPILLEYGVLPIRAAGNALVKSTLPQIGVYQGSQTEEIGSSARTSLQPGVSHVQQFYKPSLSYSKQHRARFFLRALPALLADATPSSKV